MSVALASGMQARREPSGHVPLTPDSERGFSLVEMLVVTALVMVGTAVAIPVTQAMVNRAKNDSALSVIATFVDAARDRAVAERRNIEISYVAPDRLYAHRVEVPSGLKTQVGYLKLEGGQEVHRFLSPTTLPDTPDGFGATQAFSFSGTGPWMFTSDGSLIDSQGDVANGSIFFGIPYRPESARAVTVFGMTGMMRSWKWRGTQWSE
jgi:prepilin-type N-terminal cleavage/methylation domain-containing protein